MTEKKKQRLKRAKFKTKENSPVVRLGELVSGSVTCTTGVSGSSLGDRIGVSWLGLGDGEEPLWLGSDGVGVDSLVHLLPLLNCLPPVNDTSV